jgi:DNA-binding transcriptional MerR regulator
MPIRPGDSATNAAASADPEDPPRPAGDSRSGEYLVDDLARAAGTTVRNVRAYQDRGLIAPPEIRGRTGIYNDTHLSRLKIVGQLLSRGYTLAAIGELFAAMEQGQDLGQLIGFESAVASPWTDELPATYSLPELMRMYGGSFRPAWIRRALELGILQHEGTRFHAPSPRLLRAGAELVRAGIPLDEMLEVVAQLRTNVERAAEDMVRLVEQHVFDRYGKGLPPREEFPRLSALIWRLRPLVEQAVHAEVARAMERAAGKHLGDRLAHVMEEMRDTPGGVTQGPQN